MSSLPRAATLMAAAAAASVLAAPAAAVADDSLSRPNPVRGACAFAVSLPSTSVNNVTFAVNATATSTAPAVSTSVQCFVRDGNGGELGRVGISLPGMAAEIAGTVTFDRRTPILQACIRTDAARLDGSTANENNDIACVPLSSVVGDASPTLVTY